MYSAGFTPNSFWKHLEIQMARPTLSLAKYLQMVGRGLIMLSAV